MNVYLALCDSLIIVRSMYFKKCNDKMTLANRKEEEGKTLLNVLRTM